MSNQGSLWKEVTPEHKKSDAFKTAITNRIDDILKWEDSEGNDEDELQYLESLLSHDIKVFGILEEDLTPSLTKAFEDGVAPTRPHALNLEDTLEKMIAVEEGDYTHSLEWGTASFLTVTTEETLRKLRPDLEINAIPAFSDSVFEEPLPLPKTNNFVEELLAGLTWKDLN